MCSGCVKVEGVGEIWKFCDVGTVIVLLDFEDDGSAEVIYSLVVLFNGLDRLIVQRFLDGGEVRIVYCYKMRYFIIDVAVGDFNNDGYVEVLVLIIGVIHLFIVHC